MKLFWDTEPHISLIVHESVHAFVLNKKNNFFTIVARDMVPAEDAGIIDGRLINPSFFIDTLHHVFKKNMIKNPPVALFLAHQDDASALQYTLYCEYFRVSLAHIVTKVMDKTQEQLALDLWQGEYHGKP